MLESNNDRKKLKCIDKNRRGDAFGKNEADAVSVTHGIASLKTHICGKIKALKIPKWGLDKRNARKPGKKNKPPLYVQEHKWGNGA